MSITATWRTTCTGCGKVSQRTIELTKDTIAGLGWTDIWGPGWPDGWLQRHGDVPTFFHDLDCLIAYLRAHGKDEEADKLKGADWIA